MTTKLIYTVPLLALVVFASEVFAQNLDLSKEVIVLTCNEHFYGSEKGYSIETPKHAAEKSEQKDSVVIMIRPIAKTIEIKDVTKNKILYDVKYMSHAQSANKNDLGQAYKETMFLVRDDDVLMMTHDNKKHVLNLIKNNNELQLFKNLKIQP